MNPSNYSTSTKHSVLESAASDEKFTKVFHKFSTFFGWADSSSDEDLYEGAEVENCSESALIPIYMSEIQSREKVPTNAANIDETCNSDNVSKTAHSSNEDMNDSADEGNISYKHPKN